MEKKRNGKLLRIILLVLGLLLVAYSGVLLSMNNFNLGNALPGLLGLPLLIYGIFAPFFNRWFRHGVGKVVKWIFIVGYLFLIAVFSIFSIIMVNVAQTFPAGKRGCGACARRGFEGQRAFRYARAQAGYGNGICTAESGRCDCGERRAGAAGGYSRSTCHA